LVANCSKGFLHFPLHGKIKFAFRVVEFAGLAQNVRMGLLSFS